MCAFVLLQICAVCPIISTTFIILGEKYVNETINSSIYLNISVNFYSQVHVAILASFLNLYFSIPFRRVF